MNKSLALLFLAIVFLCSCSGSNNPNEDVQLETRGENNLAYKWGKISLQCTADDTENFRPRPTVTSRILALVWISAFDAWSRYDSSAIPLYLSSVERRPVSERSLKNKKIAVSYAAYRAMREYYFSDSTLLRTKMTEFGLDPDDQSLD